jgi:rRNA biogenesis protein RRP5
LEQKQIQLEAKADARREEEFDTGGGKAQKKQKKNKVSTKGDKKGSEKKETEDSVKVESLNFKVSISWAHWQCQQSGSRY